jgi:dipeptidyl aminopeptidase/acylaminoacyl peptidase
MRSLFGALALVVLLSLTGGCGNNPRPVDVPDDTPPRSPGPAKDERKTEGPKKPERRNILVVTPRAASKILELIPEALKERKEKGPLYLRVSISNELKRKLDLDSQISLEDDFVGESRGVLTVVDRKSALSIPEGTVVDFVDQGGQRGFKIALPETSLLPADTSVSLAQARRGFKTVLARRSTPEKAPPTPPVGVMQLVKYESPAGKLSAYLTPDPKDGKKHPAIIWITGGDCNSIDPIWGDRPENNDQAATAYRKAGIVMMFPSLRGGNDNPGVKEGFFGEADDILAAADYLSKQSFVDPKRIYLGGHSTGGTMVLLVSEYSDRFRAVFSFGPVADPMGYGPIYNPYTLANPKERFLRAPIRWLHSIKSPTFVIEGTIDGNLAALESMARASKNPQVRFFPVKRANHFNILAPLNRLIAAKLLLDTGPTCNLSFTEEELNKPFAK